MRIFASIIALFQQHISYRVAAVASLPALMFLSILGGLAYWQIYEKTYEQLVASVEFQANSEANRIGEILNSVETTIETLAENSTIANGLIDSAGRETYLTPLLEGFSTINGVKVELALADFLGTTIAASDEGEVFLPFQKKIIDTIENGDSHHIIFLKDGKKILLGIDVLVYSRTKSGEGALVYLINLDEAFDLSVKNEAPFGAQLIEKGNTGETDANGTHFSTVAENIIRIIRPLPLKTELSELELSIKIEANAKEIFAPLERISVLFIGGSGAVLILIIALSLWLGREITRPLRQLKTTIDSASRQNSLDVEVLLNRQDEVGSLAGSFKNVFSSLKEMNLTLERKVEERTREFQLAKEEAEKANKTKSEFLASMSHELRTPLNAVLGFAQMLQFDPNNPLSQDQNRHVDYILQGGTHLLELVNQVLDLARVESDQLVLSLEEISANELITDCVDLSIPLGKPRGISIVDQSGRGPSAHLRTDRVRLKQALINLLSNAIKYNKDGGTVTVGSRKTDNGFLRISVADTGLGITKGDYENVFHMFHRLGTDPMITHEGTGIGLAVTKLLVERMAGRIGFESEEGVGSTFWIELPLVSNEETVIWTDVMCIGVDAIDKDHQVLVSLLNRVSHGGNDETNLDKNIMELIEYTLYHFKREEAVMEVCGYPDLENHRRLHQDLAAQVSELADEWRKDRKPELLQRFRNFLHDWLFDHIINADTKITGYTKDKNQDIKKVLESIE